VACSDKHFVEKESRQRQSPGKPSSPRFFAVNRPASARQPADSSNGITIQIRLRSTEAPRPARLLTRKNTEFWLSATD
jgi:hypothetical protein